MEVKLEHEGKLLAQINADELFKQHVVNGKPAGIADMDGLLRMYTDPDLVNELQRRDYVMIRRQDLVPTLLPTVRSERDGDGVKTWTYGPWEQATVMFRGDGAVHFDLTRIPLSKEDRLELRYEKNPDPDRSDYQYRILHALPIKP